MSIEAAARPAGHIDIALMIASVREQIALLSSRVPLVPGDIILTGTPAGTAAAYGVFLADGDVVATGIEGLGSLVNRVVPQPVAALR